MYVCCYTEQNNEKRSGVCCAPPVLQCFLQTPVTQRVKNPPVLWIYPQFPPVVHPVVQSQSDWTIQAQEKARYRRQDDEIFSTAIVNAVNPVHARKYS